MTKYELICAISAQTGETKAAVERVLNSMQDIIIAQVAAGHRVTLTNFCSWEKVKYNERVMRNPRTGAVTTIPDRAAVHIIPLKRFKAALNELA